MAIIIKTPGEVEAMKAAGRLSAMVLREVGAHCKPGVSTLELDEIAETYGFPTAAIVSMEEVVEYLYNKPHNGKIIIDDAMKASIDAYYAQYGVVKKA